MCIPDNDICSVGAVLSGVEAEKRGGKLHEKETPEEHSMTYMA